MGVESHPLNVWKNIAVFDIESPSILWKSFILIKSLFVTQQSTSMEVSGSISRNFSLNPKRITMMSESTVLTIKLVLPLMTASFACSSNLL